MKRVLVTGAGGFVGARILDMWRGQFALCAFPSDTLRTAVIERLRAALARQSALLRRSDISS